MAFANIFFIIIIVFFIDRASVVGADEATLITDVCLKTPRPAYCHNCVNSFLIVKKDTVRDLAIVAIDCTIYQASLVHGLLNHYSLTRTSPEITYCVSTYDHIQNALRQAATSWRNYKYEDAGSLLNTADSSHWSCYNLLVKAKWNIPTDLANGFYTLTSYVDVAKSVLTQIK